MRILPVLLAFFAVAHADDFGRAVRDLRHDDRERRREALTRFADGQLRPKGSAQQGKLVRALERFLSDRYPGKERALAVRALGRVGTDKALQPVVKRLEKDLDDRVLAAAATAFRKAGKSMLAPLVRRAHEDKDPLRRAIWVRLMGVMAPRVPDAARRIRLRAAMPGHWCPRAAAALALATDRSPEAAAALMALLDENEPALITSGCESLSRLTGKKNGLDILKWKAWWETRDQKSPVPEPAASVGEDGRRVYAHETREASIRPYYFGIPIKGRRVAFAFDVSASMRYKLPLAYDQLARAVKGLPSTSEFEVIFFNEHVWPWRSRLSHADPVTKERLVRHLPTIEIKSYTNLWGALDAALALEPDEVFLISDGEPNRGRYQMTKEILRELKERNDRRVPIHCISVVRTVDGDEHVKLLREIAGQHGGRYEERTLK
jgi:hypothetical protein